MQLADIDFLYSLFVKYSPNFAELAHMSQSTDKEQLSSEARRTIEQMESMIKKYTHAFPVHRPCMANPHDEAVLITGTTGAFGSCIVASLLKQPSITRIYALNRKDTRGKRTLEERQREAFLNHGLDGNLVHSPQIILLEGDVTQPMLGVSEAVFTGMQSNTTCIIHNAWPVGFNTPLASMELQIIQTRSLIDFALRSPLNTPPRFQFVSSESIHKNWDSTVVAPEQPVLKPTTPLGSGYCESKWVAETILLKAAECTPLRPIIVRVGQLSGSLNGSWTHTEWVPSFVKASELLGCLPRVYGPAAWIPTDVAAAALVEMRNNDSEILHIVHPHPVCKFEIIKHVAAILHLPIVPWATWIAALEASARGHPDPKVKSAARKVMHVFDRFPGVLPSRTEAVSTSRYPRLSTEVALRVAPSLQHIRVLGGRDVAACISYWRSIGFLSRREVKL